MTSDPADGPPGPAVRLITVSAAYGAGGSVVAPALAQRLGLPFLQRVTTTEGQVALAAAPCHERLVADEAKTTPVHRLLASLTHSMPSSTNGRFTRPSTPPSGYVQRVFRP